VWKKLAMQVRCRFRPVLWSKKILRKTPKKCFSSFLELCTIGWQEPPADYYREVSLYFPSEDLIFQRHPKYRQSYQYCDNSAASEAPYCLGDCAEEISRFFFFSADSELPANRTPHIMGNDRAIAIIAGLDSF